MATISENRKSGLYKKMKCPIKSYPKMDGEKKLYVLYPVKGKDNLYRAADVVEGGYINPEDNWIKVTFENFDSCLKACQKQNQFNGYTDSQIKKVISWSMQSEYATESKSLHWRVNSAQLLKEVLTNNTTWALARPLQIFGLLLAEVGERAAEINDPKLNALMCRLAIYSVSDPYNKDYDSKITNQTIDKIYK